MIPCADVYRIGNGDDELCEALVEHGEALEFVFCGSIFREVRTRDVGDSVHA